MKMSTSVLTTATASETVKPPKIFHRGCSLPTFNVLKGYARGTNQKEFWHEKPLAAWVGTEVIFVLQDEEGQPAREVTHVIKECYEKPIADLTREDLAGTLVKWAMGQEAVTVREYFERNFPEAEKALVIRV